MSTQSSETPWYQRSYRRMLVDMHIADWDPEFLSRYDPAVMAEMYQRANVASVMFYCQSHVGLCYWPTRSGKMHEGLRGRDVVAEMLRELGARNIPACAYYSVVFNNWAFLEHPEWRIVPPAGENDPENALAFAGTRYGLCCPNNPSYRAFVDEQMGELLGGYSFDGLFYDMTFWPRICLCEHCRARYRQETGAEIPGTIDWLSPDWCRFEHAREEWMTEFAGHLTGLAMKLQPGMAVYHNFATSTGSWALGLSTESAVHHTFLGADFYEDRIETMLVDKLMMNLSENQPIEFMTSRCVDLTDHERTKSFESMEMQALSATLFSSAFLFIDAVNLDGTVNPAVYDRIGRIFEETERYEPYLGGEPVEEIAVYFSGASRMSFTENGVPLNRAPIWSKQYPHIKAVRGACRVLQQAHLPFGVITRKQLPDLSRYRVVILPDVLRMDAEEVETFRDYVRRGGRLYASRYTSLTGTDGARHGDFQMADLFGCHFAADDLGVVTYLEMRDAGLSDSISPQRYLSHYAKPYTAAEGAGMLRLSPQAEGETLATLTLPYDKEWGTIDDHKWGSIHSSPPWRSTDHPALVRHTFGDGKVIYSAADIEAIESEGNDRLFRRLIADLLEGEPAYTAETHPAVWMTVSHQPERKRYLAGFLNYQAQLPAVPIAEVPFTLRLPSGVRAKSVRSIPDGSELPFTVDANGTLHAAVTDLRTLRMLLVEYE